MSRLKWIQSNIRWTAVVVGLIALLIPIVFSIYALRELKSTIYQYENLIAVREELTQLVQQTKDWVILQEIGAESETFDRVLSNQLVKKIDDGLDSLKVKLSADKEEALGLAEMHTQWRAFKNQQAGLSIEEILNFTKIAEKIERLELKKLSSQRPELLNRLNQVFWIIVVMSALASMVLIGTFLSIQLETRAKTQLISSLEAARLEAQAASRAKSQFLAIVSHEIRTPLNGIIGLSDLLKYRDLHPDDLNHIRIIYNSGKTLLRIINDILDFSKIENGHIALEVEPFSLSDLLDQVTETLEVKAMEKRIRLLVDLDPLLPKIVLGDSDRLSQVLFNLVGNGIKFSDGGVVLLKATVKSPKFPPGEPAQKPTEIEFSVQDSGVGMTERELQRLFQPFVQFQKTGTSGEAGTGLGLSISKALIQAMGGELKVTSTKGEGSCFSFTVPFEVKSEQQETNAMLSGFAKNPELEHYIVHRQRVCLKPLRVLLVEDNPTNQVILQSMLEKLGAEVIIAGDGEEAIGIIGSGGTAFDVIFMDCQMPRMDGFEASKKIRSQGLKLPIVALTANASKDDETKCIEAGMDIFLTKPVTLDKLFRVLRGFDEVSSSKPSSGITKSVLDQLAADIGEEASRKVVKSFCLSLDAYFKESGSLVESGSVEGLSRMAHRLKSSSRAVGALQMGDLFEQMESAKDAEEAAECEVRLRKQAQVVREDLESLQKPLG